MLKVATKTKLTPAEVIKKAVEFFGPGGYGLKVTEQTPSCVYFEGGGGKVEVITCVDRKGFSVELVSQEWDSQAREFVGQVGR